MARFKFIDPVVIVVVIVVVVSDFCKASLITGTRSIKSRSDALKVSLDIDSLAGFKFSEEKEKSKIVGKRKHEIHCKLLLVIQL